MIKTNIIIDDELGLTNHGMTETMVSTIEKSLFNNIIHGLNDISNHALFIDTKYNENKMCSNFIIMVLFAFSLLVISQNPVYDY